MAAYPDTFGLDDVAFPAVGEGTAGFVLDDLTFLLLPTDPGAVAGSWRCPAGRRAWVDRCTGRKWAVPAGGRVWRSGAMTFSGTIEKTPGDRLWLVFNFGDAPELRGATPATLGSPTITAVSGITISGVQLVGTYLVGAWYYGGTDGDSYDVTCTVTLSDTTVIERTGTLKVAKKST